MLERGLYPNLGIYTNSVDIGFSKENNTNLRVFGNLTVQKMIMAQEVEIMLDVPFPDYVFEPNYHLLSLTELDSFITNNKHLPDVPTAQEVKDSGLKLAEMNTILLKKIEEQTLYILQINKRLEELEKKIK